MSLYSGVNGVKMMFCVVRRGPPSKLFWGVGEGLDSTYGCGRWRTPYGAHCYRYRPELRPEVLCRNGRGRTLCRLDHHSDRRGGDLPYHRAMAQDGSLQSTVNVKVLCCGARNSESESLRPFLFRIAGIPARPGLGFFRPCFSPFILSFNGRKAVATEGKCNECHNFKFAARPRFKQPGRQSHHRYDLRSMRWTVRVGSTAPIDS